MSSEEYCGRQGRRVREQHKDSGVGCAMVEIHFPTLALLHTHPGALKGKIPDKMAGQPDEQDLEGNPNDCWHRSSPLPHAAKSPALQGWGWKPRCLQVSPLAFLAHLCYTFLNLP